MKTEISDKYKEIDKLLVKAKILGVLTEIPLYRGNSCYLINRRNGNYDIVIPADVKYINKDNDKSYLSEFLRRIPNKSIIKVYGGYGLVDANSMFDHLFCNELDLSDFDTQNVINMINMFYKANINHIEFGRFDTHNVLSMQCMFADFSCQSKLDITFKLCDQLYQLFFGANIKELTFSKQQDTLNFYARQMFFGATINKLSMSGFDTSNMSDMPNMFTGASIKKLDIHNFKTSKVESMESMFYGANIKHLDIRCFTPEKLKYAEHMFESFNADWIKAYGLKNANSNVIKQINSTCGAPIFFSENEYKRYISKE